MEVLLWLLVIVLRFLFKHIFPIPYIDIPKKIFNKKGKKYYLLHFYFFGMDNLEWNV